MLHIDLPASLEKIENEFHDSLQQLIEEQNHAKYENPVIKNHLNHIQNEPVFANGHVNHHLYLANKMDLVPDNNKSECVAYKTALNTKKLDNSLELKDTVDLIQKGALSELKNDNGDTIFHIIVNNIINNSDMNKIDVFYSYFVKIVKIRKINIDIENKDGQTPLQLLMDSKLSPRDKIHGTCRLLQLNANASTRDYFKKNALDLIKSDTQAIPVIHFLAEHPFVNNPKKFPLSYYNLSHEDRYIIQAIFLDLKILALNFLHGEANIISAVITNPDFFKTLDLFLEDDHIYLLRALLLFHLHKENVSNSLFLIRAACALEYKLPQMNYLAGKQNGTTQFHTNKKCRDEFFGKTWLILNNKTNNKDEKRKAVQQEIELATSKENNKVLLKTLSRFRLFQQNENADITTHQNHTEKQRRLT